MSLAMRTPDGLDNDPGGTTALRIIGHVRQPLVIPLAELGRMETEAVTDLPVFCSSGTPKGAIASCRGVLLENLIRKAEVIREEDNDTKKMFIVVSADDGYKVVFSWQEIFNTPVGGGVMILIEKEGRCLCREGGRPELISAEDYYTGARYVKRLSTIEVVLAG